MENHAMTIGQTIYVYASTHGTHIRATLLEVRGHGRFLIADAYGLRIVPAAYLRTTAAN